MFPNTLLGYFKNGLVNNHCSIRYFNRAFLAVFITEYNASKQSGIADYTKTKTTDFYNKNSSAYCVFLELWNEYRTAMDRIKAAY